MTDSNQMEDIFGDDVEVAETEETSTAPAEAVAPKSEEDKLSDEDRKILVAFREANESDKEADEVMLEMIRAGAKFNNVTRLYKKFSIIDGLALSNEEKNAKAAEIIAGYGEDVDLTEESAYETAVTAVAEACKVDAKKAASILRRYCKTKNITVYVAPKSGNRAKSHLIFSIVDALVESPSMTESELSTFVDGSKAGKTAKSKTLMNFYEAIRKGFNKVASAQ